jgi:hypothetical protein
MKIYLIIASNVIYKLVIEYLESIMNKIPDSVIILFPEQMIKKINKNDKYIFFGIEYTNYPNINLNNVYYINLEQLSMNNDNQKYNYLKKILYFTRRNSKCTLLDYSNANISILNDNNIKSIYLPYQVNYNEIYNYNKIYNCVACSTFNNRIYNVFNKISTNFDNCIYIGKPAKWGKKRDEILFKSKILINIHHKEKDYDILEEIRITRCILNKIIIVSEYSYKYEEYPLHKYIIFEEYDKIGEKVIEILNNYEYYYNKIYNDFDINEIDNILTSYITNFVSTF